MKKFINKIKKRLHNTGSSLILVIVALAFIGILVGALLTAVAFSYRQKLYDYNAKSNFYYLDQAMDEIYAGVGSKTVEALTEAYEKTREEIIWFDISSETYKNDDDETANKKFKDNFMSNFADASGSNDFWKVYHSGDPTQESNYKKSIVFAMTTMITNDSIELDDSKMKLEYIYVDDNGDPMDPKDGPDNTISVEKLSKVVIKNIRLTRTSKYNRSTANGVFTQTISSDIEITRPDFNVAFDNLNVDMSTLFEYCLVADSGVDFDRIDGNILTISGNIYAASDFYNKDYNRYGSMNVPVESFDWNQGTKTVTYPVNRVSKYTYDPSNVDNSTLFNNGHAKKTLTGQSVNLYDGKNDRSKYSGFYIDGGRVNILANTMIVPGTIAVMNGGNLSVYGKNSTDVASAEVWADEVVLGGYSLPGLTENSGVGSSAYFNANMYVKDDTQIESNYSKLSFAGGYYGFSNSQTPDERSFIPTVAKGKNSDHANIYQTDLYDASGNYLDTENRGHYNSSSILINGENATLDLTETENLFIAGRSYIELSKNKTGSSHKTVDTNKNVAGKSVNNIDVSEKVYQYDADLDDYKTGESVSVKSSQLAYYPNKASGTLEKDPNYNKNTNRKGTFTLTAGANGSALNNCSLFNKYFGNSTTTQGLVIPLIIQEVTLNAGTSAEKDKTYYYIDFEEVAKRLAQNGGSTNPTFTNMDFPDHYDSTVESKLPYWADMIKQAFIKDYCDYFNFCVNKNSDTKFDWMGYEIDYDDSTFSGRVRLDNPTFTLRYPETDQTILSEDRSEIDKVVAELQDVTNYQDFAISKVELPDKYGASPDNISTSGTITHTEKWIDEVVSSNNNKYYVATAVNKDNYSNIDSTLKGANETTENQNETGSKSLSREVRESKTSNFAMDYAKHYNYVKYALKDVYTGPAASGQSEAEFLDTMIAANHEGGITPINYYMNYDVFTEIMNAHPQDSVTNPAGGINPNNLNLGQYKVWASENDITIDGGSSLSEITGIIVTKGDVYFHNVSKFNGLIICGGKVYITTEDSSLASISSTKLCRNIIREIITKATKYRDTTSIPSDVTDPDYVDINDPIFQQNQQDAKVAIEFLKLFKAYSDIATKAENGDYHKSGAKLDITNIDYSDVLRYNNWMRNVD